MNDENLKLVQLVGCQDGHSTMCRVARAFNAAGAGARAKSSIKGRPRTVSFQHVCTRNFR